MVDTLEIARSMFPGARNNLDALCKRFGVDNSSRTNHGALLDAELLAKVYLELMGGEEPTMGLEDKKETKAAVSFENHENKIYREPRPFAATAEELEAHKAFLESKIKNAVWLS